MIRPQDIMIGDWLLADGKVIQVAAIHQKKVGYHERHDRLSWARLDRLQHIRITPDTLTAFGFERTDTDGWLYDESWQYISDRLTYEQGGEFSLWWREDEFGDREYRITTRGYGECPLLPDDSISQLQHFFYRFNHGNVLPIKYREDEETDNKPINNRQ